MPVLGSSFYPVSINGNTTGETEIITDKKEKKCK